MIVKEIKSRPVYFIGGFSKPGVEQLTRELTLLQAISIAGGLLATADGDNGFVLRGERRIPVDFTRLIQKGDVSQNLKLEVGDSVVVPIADAVYVHGEVKTPGAVKSTGDLTVLRAISQAGGVTPLAATGRVEILRSQGEEGADQGGPGQDDALARGQSRCPPEAQRHRLCAAATLLVGGLVGRGHGSAWRERSPVRESVSRSCFPIPDRLPGLRRPFQRAAIVPMVRLSLRRPSSLRMPLRFWASSPLRSLRVGEYRPSRRLRRRRATFRLSSHPRRRPPVEPVFDLHPLVAVSEQYSDNFQLTPTNRIDNFRTTISPGLFVGINGPRTRGTVSTTLDVTQDSINRFGDLGFFPTLSAGVTHAFDPRLSVSLTDTFTRSDNPALANQFGLQQQRQTFTSNTLSLSADWLLDRLATQAYYQLGTFFSTSDTVSNIAGVDVGLPLGPLMTFKIGYEFSYSTTSGATSNDSTGNLVWLSLARQLTPLNSVGISTSYSTQTLDGTRIWNPSLFAVYQLPGRLSLSGSAGFGYLSSDSGGNFPMFTANISATYRLAKAVMGVAILQGFNQTFLQAENFGVTLTRSYTGTFGYALTSFIDTNLRASYSENQATGVGNTSASADSKTFTGQAGLAWRLRQWLTMGLDYTYTRTDSAGISGGVATENQATIRLTGSF